MLPLRRKSDPPTAPAGPDRPAWERDLPTGRPVFSAEVRTAAEIVQLHRAARPDEPGSDGARPDERGPRRPSDAA